MRIPFTVVATLSFSLTLMAAESFYGTWKLNMAKSKLCSDTDIASETMKITETGPNSYRNVTDVVSKSGEVHHQESSNRYLDGKDRQIPGKAGSSQAIVRIDASTHKIINKKDGKVVGEITAVVSPDGKVQTNHRVAGTCDETMVFEKQ
jgi:hypothetical protein